MKFLCVSCDSPMELTDTKKQDSGTMSIVYECPECLQQTAMLTNAHETQMVSSLGVKIGTSESGEGKSSGCPFASMISGDEAPSETSTIPWNAEASQRLNNIPEFIRPMAKIGIEKYAVENGIKEIDEQVLEQARGSIGF